MHFGASCGRNEGRSRREEAAFEPSASRALTLGDDDRAVRRPLACELLRDEICRIHRAVASNAASDERRIQVFADLRFDQAVRRTAQCIAAPGRARDVIALLTQRRDLLPYRGTRHTETFRHPFTRYITARFTQEFQHITTHIMPPNQKAVIRPIIQQITTLRYKKIDFILSARGRTIDMRPDHLRAR